MSFRRLETLGDLAEAGFWLILACRGCGHVRAIRPAALYDRISPARAWARIRFRCTRCGGRDVLRGVENGASR